MKTLERTSKKERESLITELLKVKCEVFAPLVAANGTAVCLCERPEQHWLNQWCDFGGKPVCRTMADRNL